MNNKLYEISENIKNEYNITKYIFLYPDERTKIKKGDVVKYLDINYKINKQKIKCGIMININKNKIFFKSINNNFYWSVKLNNNYVFYFRPYYDIKQNFDKFITL